MDDHLTVDADFLTVFPAPYTVIPAFCLYPVPAIYSVIPAKAGIHKFAGAPLPRCPPPRILSESGFAGL